MSLQPGDRVDRFTLLAPLGRGAQGSVWKAADPLTGGTVALKIVPLDRARDVDLERARREARTLATLSHPALVRCSGSFEDHGRNVLGLVLDLVEGKTAREMLVDPSFSLDLRRHLIGHVIAALGYLHQQGFVHRDLKPENLLVTQSFLSNPRAPGTVKVVDLGIAIVAGNPRPLTDMGVVIGTPPFMPPELLEVAGRDSAAAPTADVFALGVLVSLLLYGRHPTGLGPNATLMDYASTYRNVAADGGELIATSGDPWLEVVRLCCALSPSRRPINAGAVAVLLPPGPPTAPTRGGSVKRAGPIDGSVTAASGQSAAEPTRADGRRPDLRTVRTNRYGWSVVLSIFFAVASVAIAAAWQLSVLWRQERGIGDLPLETPLLSTSASATRSLGATHAAPCVCKAQKDSDCGPEERFHNPDGSPVDVDQPRLLRVSWLTDTRYGGLKSAVDACINVAGRRSCFKVDPKGGGCDKSKRIPATIRDLLRGPVSLQLVKNGVSYDEGPMIPFRDDALRGTYTTCGLCNGIGFDVPNGRIAGRIWVFLDTPPETQ